MNCPKCDEEMEYQEADPSTGIMTGGWSCDACEEFIDESEADDDFESSEADDKHKTDKASDV